MNSIFRRLAALALCALLMLPAAGLGADEPPQSGVGMDISGFESYTFAGEPVDGSIFAETELTVINIWQRWCGPCWIELPHFQQLPKRPKPTCRCGAPCITGITHPR